MGTRRILALAAVAAMCFAAAPALAASGKGDCRELIPISGVFGQDGCPDGHGEDPIATGISGNAYGVHVKNLKVLGNPVGTPPPVPSVTLPGSGSGGVPITANLLTCPPSPVSCGALHVSTEGDFGNYSLSSAHVARVGISVGGVSISATAVRAVAYCWGQGPDDRGPSDSSGNPVDPATLASVTIDPGTGPTTISGLTLPNTWIPIPGIGGVMLREQWNSGSNGYQSFTENMIHVYLFSGPVTGEIIVSSAHCDGFTQGEKYPTDPVGKHGQTITIEI